jgi:hypothetical protein
MSKAYFRNGIRRFCVAAALWSVVLGLGKAAVAADVSLPVPAGPVQPEGWLANYGSALARAEGERKFALLWFVDPTWSDGDAAFERVVLQHPEIAERLEDRFIAARLLTSATFPQADKPEKLLGHASFAEMLNSPGLAIIDLTEPGSPQHRRVVSVLPFRGAYPTREQLAVLLDLPRGTLTQRTLIYAVRTHADRPASTACEFSPLLAQETASHAAYQASLNLQGHHHWESRFHAINAKLPGGLLAQEVCAESWPGQSLVDAAVECVDSWRHSPGHWEAVSGKHEAFGYDMQRGTNGVWYAAGIFAQR